MRTADLIGLAIFALGRHRLRTALTGLGVLFGTLVLIVSLSIRAGVQRTIVRQVSKYAELRRVEVHPGPGVPTAKDEPLAGAMSDARRQRLLRERRYGGEEVPPERRLTPARLRQIAALDHVRHVEPTVRFYGEVRLGEAAEGTNLLAMPADLREGLRQRLVAGELPGEDEAAAVVTEMLLYQLGVRDEAEQARVVGQALAFELTFDNRPRPALLVSLLTGRSPGAVAPGDQAALAKLLRRLPASLDRLGLDKDEQQALGRLFGPAPRAASSYTFRYPIRGVVRAAEPDEMRRRGAWALQGVGLVVSRRAGDELFGRLPWGEAQGYGEAIVEVDDPAHVKAVQEALREMGLRSQSAIEYIEREQFTHVLVFTGMTVVALIALLVAASGITNTMLMSVLERTREIGVMKAVGARDAQVQAMFLMEGAVIGAAGGLLGLLAAWGVSYPADAWLRRLVAQRLRVELDGSLFAFPWWLAAGAPLLAVALTTAAAWWPARRAVRIDPVQALRE